MKRNTILKIINPLLAVLVLSQILTGMLGDNLPHEAFELLHEGGGYALAVVAALHLALNWNWVKSTYFKRRTAPPAK